MRKNLLILLVSLALSHSALEHTLFAATPPMGNMSAQEEDAFFESWLKEMETLIKEEDGKAPAKKAPEKKEEPKKAVRPEIKEPTDPDALFLQPVEMPEGEKDALPPKLSPAREKVFSAYLRELVENLNDIEKSVQANTLGIEAKEELDPALERGAQIEKELGEIESKKLYHRTFFLKDFNALRRSIKDLKEQSKLVKQEIDGLAEKIKLERRERDVEEEESILTYYWNLLKGAVGQPILPPHLIEQQKRTKPEVARLFEQDLKALQTELEKFSGSESIKKEKEAKIKTREQREQEAAHRKPPYDSGRSPFRDSDYGDRDYPKQDWWKNYDDNYSSPSSYAPSGIESKDATTTDAKDGDDKDKTKTFWPGRRGDGPKKEDKEAAEKKRKEDEEAKRTELENQSLASLISKASAALKTIAGKFPQNYKQISFVDEKLAQVLRAESEPLHLLMLTLQALDKKPKDDSEKIQAALEDFHQTIYTYHLAFLKLAKHGYCSSKPFEVTETGEVKTGQDAARFIWKNITNRLPQELHTKLDADLKIITAQLQENLKTLAATQINGLGDTQITANYRVHLSLPIVDNPRVGYNSRDTLVKTTQHLIILTRVLKTAVNAPLPIKLSDIAPADANIGETLLQADLLAHKKYSQWLKNSVDSAYKQIKPTVDREIKNINNILNNQILNEHAASVNKAYITQSLDYLDADISQDIIQGQNTPGTSPAQQDELRRIEVILIKPEIRLAVLYKKLNELYKQQLIVTEIKATIGKSKSPGPWRFNPDTDKEDVPLKIKQAIHLGDAELDLSKLGTRPEELEIFIAKEHFIGRRIAGTDRFNIQPKIDQIDVITGLLQNKIKDATRRENEIRQENQNLYFAYQSTANRIVEDRTILEKSLIQFEFNNKKYGIVGGPRVRRRVENYLLDVTLSLYPPEQTAEKLRERYSAEHLAAD